MVRKIPVDMVVLSAGLEPRADANDVRRLFNIGCSGDGFFLERHPKLAPVSTFTDGIFLAGCCQGPKDIPDTVAQAGRGGGRRRWRSSMPGSWRLEPNTAYVMEEACSGCKTCIPLCPYQRHLVSGRRKKARINEVLCKGCGTCVAACPSGSIRQNLFEDTDLRRDRGDSDLCLKPLNPRSWRFSVTGARIWPRTWPGLRASSTRPTRAWFA